MLIANNGRPLLRWLQQCGGVDQLQQVAILLSMLMLLALSGTPNEEVFKCWSRAAPYGTSCRRRVIIPIFGVDDAGKTTVAIALSGGE